MQIIFCLSFSFFKISIVLQFLFSKRTMAALLCQLNAVILNKNLKKNINQMFGYMQLYLYAYALETTKHLTDNFRMPQQFFCSHAEIGKIFCRLTLYNGCNEYDFNILTESLNFIYRT